VRSHQAEAPVRECGAKDQVSRVGAPRILGATALLAAALVAACLLSACSPASDTGSGPAGTPLPKGSTLEAGVLTVAVDPSLPPFAGKAGGRLAGLDVDVASALGDALGVKVRFVTFDRSKLAAAVASPTADIALGGFSTSQIVAAGARTGGVYAFDGPVLFASRPATLTLDTLAGRKPGAQDRSEAWWRLRDVYGERVASLETLRDAFGALADGRIDTLGADALVGGYIARDFPGARLAGAISVRPLEVAVLGQDPGLADTLRRTMLGLESSGVLQTLRAKWAGAAGAASFAAGTRGVPGQGGSAIATGAAVPVTAAP
jgi:polar amino acid transport system substrate-binding protein